MSREQFEAWMTSEQGFHGSDFKWDEHRNYYSEFGIHIAYKAYLAAIASMQSERDQLAAQLADVVAENALLKSAAKETLAHWAAAEPGEMEPMMDKCMPSLRVAYCETPATDRFIAEQRAFGVEMFAANEMEWAAHWEKHGVQDGSVSRCIMVAQDANKFAAQLRNEVKV